MSKVPRNETANRAVDFINSLTCTGDFQGQPFTLRPWQDDFVRRLFGTLDKQGRRVYRSAFVFCPRRQGKSSLIASICTMQLFTGPPGQNILLCASDRNQASHIWKIIAEQIRAEPYLLNLIGGESSIVRSTKRIAYPAKNSVVCCLANDGHASRGWNPSTLVFDEIVAFGNNRELWDVLTAARSSRAEPLTIALSTAGDQKESLIWERLEYAKRVAADPSVDPQHLPVLFMADESDPWDSEDTWRKCCPALNEQNGGAYCNIEEIRALCREAKELPYLERVFRREYLNQFVDCSDSVWIRANDFASCAVAQEPDLSSRPVMAVDLSRTTDLTSAAFCWPLGDDRYYLKAAAWIPHDTMRKAVLRDKVPYDLWKSQGWLRTCPGEAIDYHWLLAELTELIERYNPTLLLWDRWGARYLIQALEPLGVPQQEHGQGSGSMSQPTKEFERLVLQKRLSHDGSPVLAWCVNNVVIEPGKMESASPSKRLSRGRIDCAIASIMALDGAMSQNMASVYESKGLFV